MKKALVTGANGFVGSALIRELLKNGVEVIAVIKDENESISHISSLSEIHIIYCELSKINSLATKISDRDIDVIYHLGWAGSTGSERANYNLQLQNSQWTCDVVNLALELGIKRFVGAGTLAEFDCNAYIMKDGSTPNDVSCYGSAKLAAHYMSKAVANKKNVEHVWAYLSNTYGIGNRTQNFVNFASKLMLEGKRASFTNGEQFYDFVYITDIAHALYLIGEKGYNNYAYYIGSGKTIQLKNYIEMIRDCINPEIPLYLGEIPFNGISLEQSVFDCTKLTEHTGYTSQISFEKGIAMTIDWLKEQL